MSDIGTLKELGVGVGDVVIHIDDPECEMTITECPPRIGSYFEDHWRLTWGGHAGLFGRERFRLVSRANQPKPWSDLTAEEKGALLLARYEGKVVENGDGLGKWWTSEYKPFFIDAGYYRIKPNPKTETVTLFYKRFDTGAHHEVGTIDLVDGVPDCGTLKMEALK